jgi:hypothetical protein
MNRAWPMFCRDPNVPPAPQTMRRAPVTPDVETAALVAVGRVYRPTF